MLLVNLLIGIKAQLHLATNAKYVVITTLAKDENITIILGVNKQDYNPKIYHIISLGSCTTNVVVPMFKVLHESFNIVTGFITIVHAVH